MPEPSSMSGNVRLKRGATVGHRQHDHLGADADPRIEVGDVLIGEAQATGGDMGTYRL
ncbi:hypothetical protein chiPu_0030038, partial [Chiloscyllium punctatum]|nr:hypothetical protein [Chiloscyllium punctatum]